MKDFRVHYFNSFKATHSRDTIPLEDFLRMRHLSGTIQELRSLEPGTTGYKRVKDTLPIVLFNVSTNGGKKNGDITAYNPLLFLDVDKISPDHLDLVKQKILKEFPSVLMCWRSCGGKGLGILIHTHGISDINWSSLGDRFASYEFHGYRFDLKCFTRTRPTFISLDDEAYINWDAPPLDLLSLPELTISKTKSHSEPPPTPKDKIPENTGMGMDGALRFSDLDTFFTGEHHDTPRRDFPDGVMLIQVERSYRKIREGDRNAFLFRNLVRLLHLNPSLSLSALNSLGRKVNERCEPRMDDAEIASVAQKVFSNRYPAFPNKRRKILYNPRIRKSAREKQSEARQILNRLKGERTAGTIYRFIEGYDGEMKLTNKMISEATGIPLRTIERHVKRFREMIDHNHEARAEARPKEAAASALEVKSPDGPKLDRRTSEKSIPAPTPITPTIVANGNWAIVRHLVSLPEAPLVFTPLCASVQSHTATPPR